MKKLLITAMALSCFALSYGQKKVEKQIIGKWCNPYTYKSTGELKGFEFKKGGKCSAINIPSLDLKTWKVDNGYLIVEGFSKEDDGKVEVYKTRERIGYLVIKPPICLSSLLQITLIIPNPTHLSLMKHT